MAFSIWEYLRERTRDAVLAGMQDAMDIVEQDDTSGSQHAPARQLASRLSTPEVKQLPGASMNGEPARQATTTEPAAAPSRPARVAPAARAAGAPTRPAEPTSFDDALERRLDAAAPQHGQEAVQPGRLTTRRKRGRPPKSERPGESR
jgi:hypothetical protein